MHQKDTFLRYYDQAEGGFFRLSINGKVSLQQTKDNDKQRGREALDKAFNDLIADGDKLELTVSTGSNFTGGVTLSKYNTSTGAFMRASSNPGSGFQGNESSYKMGFEEGYRLGLEAGERKAENAHIMDELRYLRENGTGNKLDLARVAENLTSTEQGVAILSALATKFGVL